MQKFSSCFKKKSNRECEFYQSVTERNDSVHGKNKDEKERPIVASSEQNIDGHNNTASGGNIVHGDAHFNFNTGMGTAVAIASIAICVMSFFMYVFKNNI